MNDYEIIQLSASTLGYLDQLYVDIHNKKAAQNYFLLKYDTAYTGEEFIGFFALFNKKPVAYYGVIPVKISIRNSPVLAAQSCDTMTHPDHRKKGLFVMLANRTFELAKQKNINFIFGFPNANSYPGFVDKLGFVHSETMNRYTLNFSDSWIKKIQRKLFISSTRKIKPDFGNSLLEQGFDGCIYDNEFFNYKRYNKNFVVSLSKNFYWINNYANLFVGALSNENVKSLPEQIELLRKNAHSASFTFIISKGTKLDSALSSAYSAQEGFPVIIKDLSGKFPLDNLKFQFADIDIF